MMQLCQPALVLASLWFPQHKSNGFWIVVWNKCQQFMEVTGFVQQHDEQHIIILKLKHNHQK